MQILILGGTRFVGRHLTEAALAAGHSVTLFNRGQSNPDLFSEVETLVGDRDGGLDALKDREWDVVIDVSGYVPRLVRDSAEIVNAERYVFISTISVYADNSVEGITEDSPLATLEDEATEEITGETYGGLKVLCEQVVEEVFPGKALIIRPGLVVGPHDPTSRFTYWPVRVAQGGEVLAPDSPDKRTQFIDGRDLAEFTIKVLDHTGIYTATGTPVTMGDVLSVSKNVSGSDAAFTWVDEAFLLEHEVGAFMELPLWLPEAAKGFSAIDVGKAVAAGLTFRDLKTIVADTLAWAQTLPEDFPRRGGLAPEREAELLRAWHQRHG